jgi:hypothetical protein
MFIIKLLLLKNIKRFELKCIQWYFINFSLRIQIYTQIIYK